MKLHLRRLVWVALFALSIAACAENEYVEPPPPTVTVAAPTVEDVTDYLSYTGRARAVESVQVQARVKGFLQSMHYVPGTLVEKGDLLFVIDPEPFEVEVSARKADLSSREAEAALAQTSFDRSRELYRQKATSEIEYLRFKAERDKANAAVLAAEAALADAQLDLDYAYVKSPISGRAGRHRVDLGNLVGADETTLLTEIVDYSPLFVYFQISELDVLRVQRALRERAAEQAEAGDAQSTDSEAAVASGNAGSDAIGGEPASSSASPAAAGQPAEDAAETDASRDAIAPDAAEGLEEKVVDEINAGDAGELVEGKPRYGRDPGPNVPRVEVGLADEEGYPHTGYLDFSDSSIDPETGTLELRGILENEGDFATVILPGSFTRVRVPVGVFEDALLVPDLAVGSDQGGRYLLVVAEGDLVEQRMVEVGEVYDGRRRIVSGISAGDRIVVKGLQRARPGAKVTPVDQGPVHTSSPEPGSPIGKPE